MEETEQTSGKRASRIMLTDDEIAALREMTGVDQIATAVVAVVRQYLAGRRVVAVDEDALRIRAAAEVAADSDAERI